MKNLGLQFNAALIFFSFFLLVGNTSGKDINDETVKMYKDSATGIQMVFVQGGCFEMGCGDWMISCEENEKPPHPVCVDSFWMGKFEVTQGEWRKLIGENPSDYKGGDDHPVEMVSWYDVQEFIKKLNEQSQGAMQFRLPTEAEWEYAARSGGKNQIYAGGNSEKDKLWHEFRIGKDSFYEKGIQTWPVGLKKPNGLGLYDMSGNVSEWCQDYYRPDYYAESPEDNPKGPLKGNRRVFRGGTHSNHLEWRRTTRRYGAKPSWQGLDLGFRIVAESKK